jgi:adenylate cyclase
MGAKKKPGVPRKKKKVTPERISQVVAELSDPEATAVSRVRSIASTFELEKVVDILDSSEDVLAAVGKLLRREGGRYTVEEAAEKAGLAPEKFRQLNLACGFADPGPDARVFTDEDIEVLQLFQASTEVFGEDLALQNVRVIGHAMSRIADAFISSFAVMIGRQSREAEITDEDLARATETAIAMLPSAVRAMDVLIRRHMELKSRPDFLLGDDWEGVDAVDRAIGFCDLVGYTALAQQISDNRLATTLRAFETTASDLITEQGADLVKLIGDEVMFVAPDARTAVDVGLSLAERFDQGDVLPPVRCGINAGRVIVREGDYHGPVVNLAARIVKLAPPGGVMCPASLADALGTDFTFEDAGDKELKGFADLVPLVVVRR